jgi:hypothetical protein
MSQTGDYNGIVTFYHTANASRSTKLPDGRFVTFEVYKFFAGAWEGVAAVEDQGIVDGLDELSRKPKSGIARITEEEYKDAVKKKPLPRNSPRLAASPLLPPLQAAIINRADRPAGVVVVNEPKPGSGPPAPVAAVPKIFDSLDEVLKIGAVKPIEGSQNAEAPKKDMGERSARSRSTSQSRRPKYDSDPKPLIATMPPLP